MFGVSLTGSLEVFLSTAMRLQAVVVECLGVFWEVRLPVLFSTGSTVGIGNALCIQQTNGMQ